MENVGILRLTSDNRRFTEVCLSEQGSNNEIWVSDVMCGNARRFTYYLGYDTFPVWSPDGSRLVWASNRSGSFKLYEKAADGTGQDTLLFESGYPVFPNDWSRDGRYLTYRQIDPQTKYDVWVLPLLGERKPFPILRMDANETTAVLSPDGRWLAYSSDETGRYEVYVQIFSGSAAHL